MQNKKTSLLFFLSLTGIFFTRTALAVCPLCVVAVGAGLGLSRWLGVDDVVSSLWIGAILAALSMWTADWMKKRGWEFKFDQIAVWLAYYLLVLAPLYYYDVAGHPQNRIFGIDKILFGSILGTLCFVMGVLLNNFLKKRNSGRQYFNYQKVVLPFLVMVVTSSAFYVVLKYFVY